MNEAIVGKLRTLAALERKMGADSARETGMKLVRIGGRVLCLLLLACALPCQAQENKAEQKLFELLGFDTFSASFEQRLYNEKSEVVEVSEGLVWISRPRMFRWEYSSPTRQILVSNGQDFVNYDLDLKQAAVSPLSDAIGQLPMVLLLGQDFPREHYTVQFLPKSDGYYWLVLSPQSVDSDFSQLRLAYRGQAIRRIELMDRLSQKSVVEFSERKINKKLRSSTYHLYLPPDVDVAGSFSIFQQTTPH